MAKASKRKRAGPPVQHAEQQQQHWSERQPQQQAYTGAPGQQLQGESRSEDTPAAPVLRQQRHAGPRHREQREQASMQQYDQDPQIQRERPYGFGTFSRPYSSYVEVDTETSYSRTPMDIKAAYAAISRESGLPIRDLQKLVADAQKHAASALTQPAKAKSRALWENRKGADAKLSPPEFIAKHYAAEMAAGTLHRGVIAQEDKPLAVKLASWLRSNPMPEGVDIPTKPEWITRQAEAGKARSAYRPATTEDEKVYNALAQRRWRARHRSPAIT